MSSFPISYHTGELHVQISRLKVLDRDSGTSVAYMPTGTCTMDKANLEKKVGWIRPGLRPWCTSVLCLKSSVHNRPMLNFRSRFAVLAQIHQSFCMWPWIRSGNAAMFYPLLCTSLCDKNGNLAHHHRFLLHTKRKAWDKTLELMYSIFPNLKHLMLAIIHEVYRALI